MEKRALLIDFDGTLVDSEVVHYDSWQHVLSPFDIHYTEQAFCIEFAGVPTLQAATVIKKRHNLDVSAQWLCEHWLQIQQHRRQCWLFRCRRT